MRFCDTRPYCQRCTMYGVEGQTVCNDTNCGGGMVHPKSVPTYDKTIFGAVSPGNEPVVPPIDEHAELIAHMEAAQELSIKLHRKGKFGNRYMHVMLDIEGVLKDLKK